MSVYFYPGLLLAGGVGVVFRYWLGRFGDVTTMTSLPYGTLAANLIGCFLIGLLSTLMIERWPMSSELRIILLTGFLGGFTTFSAFSLETLTMLEQGAGIRALLYVGASVVLSVFLCFAGVVLAKQTIL